MADDKHEEKICPSCGSTNIDCCLDCKVEGDFSGTSDKEFADLIEKARKHSAAMMIETLSVKNRFNMSYMERALDLPTRTMMRWKSGDISAAALSLLRLITTYPWLIDVADSRFDETFAKKVLIKEGMAAMFDFAEVNNWGGNVTFAENVYGTGRSFDAHMHFFKPDVITDAVSTSGADFKWLSVGAI
jgi:hypothetical protein